jgi:KDO2-lipid IV(A) lauroyltransferase
VLVVALVQLMRLLPTNAAINASAWVARTIGPLLPAHRIGRKNLTLALPERGEDERAKILSDAWDSLGRMAAEFVFVDRIFDLDPDNLNAGRIEVEGAETFVAIREGNRPSIMFTAHTANWELLAVCAARFDLDVSVLFRPLNNVLLGRWLDKVRGSMMGTLIESRSGALLALGGVLERGGNVGLLVDQRFHRGLSLPFFGHPAKTNPSLGKLARRYDCDVYASRAVRLPKGRIRLELTGPIELPRDASGAVDVEATMIKVNGIVEGWVRENPGQWLWMHRRWRP